MDEPGSAGSIPKISRPFASPGFPPLTAGALLGADADDDEPGSARGAARGTMGSFGCCTVAARVAICPGSTVVNCGAATSCVLAWAAFGFSGSVAN